jgi:hypothetical protein
MGVQPATLQAGLVAATASSDTTPPTATITSPSSGDSLPNGQSVTITGTATDTGGGVVGAVEVSTDGGTTWHPADGRDSWSYSWVAAGNGPATILARAVDDSANLQGAPTSVNVNVTCPCTIFGVTVPDPPESTDATPVEVGVRFKSDVDGWITGVRFYKGPDNTGVHTGSLWSDSGALLATATFTSETVDGWQTVSFDTPVPVTAGTVYVASYYAPAGHYSANLGWFSVNGTDQVPLHALRDSPTTMNGVFATEPGFPNRSFDSANYWVDVVFDTTGP